MPPRKKTVYCVHHPDVKSTGTCFECAKPVCYNCTLDLFGRTFCSHHCGALYLAANVFKSVVVVFTALVRGIASLFKALGISSLSSVVSWILVGGLITSLFFIWRLDSQIRRMESGRSAESGTPVSGSVAAPKIMAPPGGTVTSNLVTVEGEAEDNSIVSLTVNGVLEEVMIPRDGRFVFENIRLHRGENRVDVRALSADGQLSTLETLAITYADPALSFLVRNVSRGSLDRPEVALTFDGGAEDNAAASILDALKEKNIKATFFLTGTFVSRFPEIVRRIARDGHEVGNHTWSHPHLTSFAENRKQETLREITPERLKMELERTAVKYAEMTGRSMIKLWRAPFGEYNAEILKWAAESGYRHIAWTGGRGWENNGDTMDWVVDSTSGIYHTSEEIVQKVIRFGQGQSHGANGAVMLMHLGTNRVSDPVHLRLAEMIDGLRARGIEPVTVTELLR